MGLGNVSDLDLTYIVIHYSNIGIIVRLIGLRLGLLGMRPFPNVCCHPVSCEET